jgi:hypothetical protein
MLYMKQKWIQFLDLGPYPQEIMPIQMYQNIKNPKW